MTGAGPPGPLVEARGLSFVYPGGRPGLHALDLTLAAGEIVAVLGPNGAGKSTLLRLVRGEARPSTGRLRVLGAAGPPGPSVRRRVASVEDTAAHFEALSGLDNALFFARAAGLAPTPARHRVGALLEAFGLADDAGAPVSSYSFGMKRKLLLVEAFAPDPSLLLLDEPTVGLDPPGRAELQRRLEAGARAGAAALVATNDLAAAEQAHRILFLHRGRVVASAPPRDLLDPLDGLTLIRVGARGPLPTDAPLPDGVRRSEGPGEAPGTIVFETRRGSAALPDLCRALEAAGVSIRDVQVREPGLADAFRRLTGDDLEGLE